MDMEQLVEDIMANAVDIEQLSGEEVEAVIEYMYEAAESMLGGEHDAVAQAMLEVIGLLNGPDEFEAEIEASVARGNSYFELEQYTLQ
jgi:hypothetical protein